MVEDATRSLISVARNLASTEAELKSAAQSFINEINRASPDKARGAMDALAECFDMEDAARAGFLAALGGALVEMGHDPQPIAGPLTRRLASLLESAASLAKRCVAQLPPTASEKEERDPAEAFEETRRQIAPTMPDRNASWEALKRFWPPAIAVFSASAEARANARPLDVFATAISDYHEAGYWLATMLSVLDDEPILVIEPGTRLGMLGRISGIADNFQLHTLLMEVFPQRGWFPRRRVSQRAADVARGIGPQETGESITGVWNLYTHRALCDDLTLPQTTDQRSTAFWIWGEGRPADIPIFDGRRVVLLGPSSYARAWSSSRIFSKLAAQLQCERILKKAEVSDWLQRIAASNAAHGSGNGHERPRLA